MKKFDIPVMEVAKFDADDVVTTSGTTWENSNAKDWASYRLTGEYEGSPKINADNVLTFTF